MATIAAITTPAGLDAQLAQCYGDKLGLRNTSGQQRNATAAEVRQYLIDILKADFAAWQDKTYATAKPAPTDLSPS